MSRAAPSEASRQQVALPIPLPPPALRRSLLRALERRSRCPIILLAKGHTDHNRCQLLEPAAAARHLHQPSRCSAAAGRNKEMSLEAATIPTSVTWCRRSGHGSGYLKPEEATAICPSTRAERDQTTLQSVPMLGHRCGSLGRQESSQLQSS